MNEHADLIELWTGNYTSLNRFRCRSRERNPYRDLLGHRRRLRRRRHGRGHLPRKQIFDEWFHRFAPFPHDGCVRPPDNDSEKNGGMMEGG